MCVIHGVRPPIIREVPLIGARFIVVVHESAEELVILKGKEPNLQREPTYK